MKKARFFYFNNIPIFLTNKIIVKKSNKFLEIQKKPIGK
jgi:hypothetical protein